MTKQAKQTWNLKVAYKFTLEKQTHKTKSFVKGLNLSLNCPLQHKWPMTQNNLIQHKRPHSQLPHYFKLQSCINIQITKVFQAHEYKRGTILDSD